MRSSIHVVYPHFLLLQGGVGGATFYQLGENLFVIEPPPPTIESIGQGFHI